MPEYDGKKISELPYYGDFNKAVQNGTVFPLAEGSNLTAKIGAADIDRYMNQKITSALSGIAEQNDLDNLNSRVNSIVYDISNISNSLGNYIRTSEKGVADGVATLDEDGKVPAEQLPEMNFSGNYTVIVLDNVDFDTILSFGNYEITNSKTNAPSTNPTRWKLFVYGGGNTVIQDATYYNASAGSGNRWWRKCENGSWLAWNKYVLTTGEDTQIIRGDGGLANRKGRSVSGNAWTLNVADTVLKLTDNTTLGSGAFEGQTLTIYNSRNTPSDSSSKLTISSYAIPGTINITPNHEIWLACEMIKLVWDDTYECWRSLITNAQTTSIGTAGQTVVWNGEFDKNKYLYIFNPTSGNFDLNNYTLFTYSDIGKVYSFFCVSNFVTNIQFNTPLGQMTYNLIMSNPSLRLTLIEVNDGVGIFLPQ